MFLSHGLDFEFVVQIASLSSGSKHAVTGSAKAADAKGKKVYQSITNINVVT